MYYCSLLLSTKKVTFHHLRGVINVGWPHGFALEVVSILMCCVLVGSTFLRGTINTMIFRPLLVTGLLQLSSF